MAKIGQDFHHLWENIHTLYERLKAHNTPKAAKPSTPAPGHVAVIGEAWQILHTRANSAEDLKIGDYLYTQPATWFPMKTAPQSPVLVLLLGKYDIPAATDTRPLMFVGTSHQVEGSSVLLLGWMPLPTTTVVADA